MFKWISKSFKRQVIFVIFSVTLSVGALIIANFYLAEKERLNSILESQVSQMSHRFSLSISDKVFFNKYFELSDSILDLYDYNHQSAAKAGALFEIKEIAVVNKDMEIIGHSDPINYPLNTKYNLNTKDINDGDNLFWNTDHTMFSIIKEIYNSNEVIGYLYMGIDPLLLKQRELSLLKDISVLISVFLLILIFFSFLFARWIDRPLLEITEKLNILGDGNIDFATVLKRNDEFYILAKAIVDADKRIYKQKDYLEQRVKERTIELNEKADSLNETLINLKAMQKQLVETEKMSALGNLVAGVAHEINTPIGVSLTGITHIEAETKKIIKSMSDNVLKKSVLQKYLELVDKMSTSMHLSLRTAAQLIRSFKQVAIDQHTEDKRRFDLREYVDEVLLSLHSMLKHTNIELENKINENIFIYSYAGIYSQMYTNFIMNSLVHGFYEQEKGKIILKAEIKDETLFISYEDNGKGLEKSVLDKMFNPFFTTKMGKGGSGLGLSVIYNLVTHKLKGKIRCESVLGHGMKMFVDISISELKGMK